MWLYIHGTSFKSFGTQKFFGILSNFVKQFSHNTKSLISGDWLHINSSAFDSVSGRPPSLTPPIFGHIGHIGLGHWSQCQNPIPALGSAI